MAHVNHTTEVLESQLLAVIVIPTSPGVMAHLPFSPIISVQNATKKVKAVQKGSSAIYLSQKAHVPMIQIRVRVPRKRV